VSVLIPETNLRLDPTALSARSMARNYGALLANRTFVAYSLAIGLMFSGQLVFISGSSFVLIDELGLSAGMFGLAFAFVAIGIMGGATLSSWLVSRWSDRNVVLLGAVGLMAASWLILLVVLLVLVLMRFFGIPIEERALERKFGDAWREYAATTGRLLPERRRRPPAPPR